AKPVAAAIGAASESPNTQPPPQWVAPTNTLCHLFRLRRVLLRLVSGLATRTRRTGTAHALVQPPADEREIQPGDRPGQVHDAHALRPLAAVAGDGKGGGNAQRHGKPGNQHENHEGCNVSGWCCLWCWFSARKNRHSGRWRRMA